MSKPKAKKEHFCEWCGKDMSDKPSYQKHCSKKCESEHRLAKGGYKGYNKEDAEASRRRPLTEDTVYYVNLWLKDGDSIERIAKALNRNKCTIEAIANGITDKELIPLEEQ